MTTSTYARVLILYSCLWHTVSGDDCIYQECLCSGSDILCDNLGLHAIPQRVAPKNPSLANMVFDNNMITTIPAGSLPPNLTQISFLHNPLTTIDEAAFVDSANTLETITFSEVLFTKIPDAFVHLNNVGRLIIYDTRILDWNENVMKKIGPTVETLYLENVGFHTWPSWMSYFSRISELSFVNNSLAAIPDNGLEKLNSLTSLTLNNNSLTAVPKALSRLKALQMLYLEFNKISDVTWLAQTSKLNSLSLNNNKIFDAVQLSHALRPFAETLYDLSLNFNELRAIPDFYFLTQIGYLDFSHNNISDPISGSVPSGLFALNLGNNHLGTVPRIMGNLTHVSDVALTSNYIKELNGTNFPPFATGAGLGYNLISQLTDTSFPQNSDIQFLYLNNNPLSRISTLAFKNLPRLIQLNLVSTKLTRLPLALSSLINLSVLNISGNTDLVCTCAEKSVGQWFKSLLSANVAGSCGQTSVYNFFAVLSQGCP